VVLSSRPGSPDPSWRLANGALGAVHLSLIANATRAAIRARLLEPIPLRFVLIPGGYFAVLANVAVVLGFLQEYGAMVFCLGLVWFLFVSAVQFVMLIFLHTDAT